MENYIEKYISQKIKIFACNADKTPAISAGFYGATTDPATLKVQFKHPETMLIGMPTGNMNGLVVIDIDVNKEGDIRTVDELLEALQEFGEIPDTFQTQTPSGGRHLWFTVPYTKLSSSRRFFAKDLPIDIRANGGYACVPDGKKYIVYDDYEGIDIDNIKIRCKELPEWITNYKKSALSTQQETGELIPPEEVREIRSALSFLSSDDRDLWIRIGMALKSTGAANARGLWDEWSEKSDKYKPKDQEQRWNGLRPRDIDVATVFYEAKKAGWTTTYEKRNEKKPIPSTTIIPRNIQQEYNKKIYERKPFPKELLNPPGLVGELVNYINERSIKEQPIYALAASLCAVGALEGRKIQTETGTRTNIYCLGVGPSGSGKDAARKAIKDCFHFAGCGDMASVEDVASDAAISTALQKEPSQVFLLDEIGRFLKTTQHASKSPHLYNIVSVILKLYSSSTGVYYGKIYAEKDRVKIDNPNLCIYGTTVPEVLYKGLTFENITDGFLSRMLIFESEDPDPEKKSRKNLTKKPPQYLTEKISKLHKKETNNHAVGNLDQINVDPQIVPINENAIEIIKDFDKYIREYRNELREQNRVDTIYNRTSQIAEQVALILAGGINIDEPVITEKEIIYGVQLVKYLSDNMLYIAENFVADNEYHHSVKEILKIIRNHGKISMTELTRKTQQLQGFARNDMIETLKGSEQIMECSEGTGVNKKRIFVAV